MKHRGMLGSDPGPHPSRYFLILIFILISPAFAWDDEDDSFGKASSTRRSSLIDYGYGQQKNNSAYQRQNSVIDLGGFKKADSLDSTIHVQPISRPKLETVQQSLERQNNELWKINAESQRQFEEQKARRDAEYAKQEAFYAEFDRQKCEMKEFVGGVYKAEFGAVTGRNSAVTTEGYIYRSGNIFVTPRGIYSKDRDVYAGPDGITVKSGDLFYGTEGTTLQTGSAFFSEGNSGYIVGPNCFNKAGWSSR